MLQERQLRFAVFVSPEMVQYLTGFRPHRLLHAAVVLSCEGHCVLFAPNHPPQHFQADEVRTFPAQQLATLLQHQSQNCLVEVFQFLSTVCQGQSERRIGAEFTSCSLHAMPLAESCSLQLIDVDTDLWQLRRNKDADELVLMTHAITCTEAMYRTAREIIQPGITELQVFNELHRVAVLTASEPLLALGNDFQCNSPGGPARRRPAQAGELYILDLGPCVGGYYADNCRTISVDRQPTDIQMRAWQTIRDVFNMVENTVRPGVRCRIVFQTAMTMLEEFRPGAFPHHLGHGIGLYPHEAPHLNPCWDEVFAEGDVFTAEPGLYDDTLRAGIRLEQNYRVSTTGVELLTPFPLDLT